jgi:thiosulfate dehydrogenase (quinone) large subunit
MRRSTPFDAFLKASYKSGFMSSALILRIVFGALFFMAGWSKIFADGGWSAAGYLSHATGPFASFFQSLAGSGFVDVLNMYGLLFIGLALMLGLLVRTASFMGLLLMVLYYFADFVGNTAHGFIDEHFIYAFVFVLFIFGGFGHVWGIDSLIERRIDQRSSWVKIFFG